MPEYEMGIFNFAGKDEENEMDMRVAETIDYEMNPDMHIVGMCDPDSCASI